MTDLSDAELTKLCAKAMGIFVNDETIPGRPPVYALLSGESYDPLNDDGQAMAIVKLLEMDVLRSGQAWHVATIKGVLASQRHADLNRAIVICAAKTEMTGAERLKI